MKELKITHYRKSKKVKDKVFYFSVVHDKIFMLNSQDLWEDCTKNEDIKNLSVYTNNDILGEIEPNVDWLITLVKDKVLTLLKNKPDAVITSIVLNYELNLNDKIVIDFDD